SAGLSFSALAAGASHTCGLTNSGATYCWGARGDGQLGDGTPQVWWAPGAVSWGSSFTALAAAGDYAGYTCGLTSAGAAYCWGSNLNGELGNGSTTWSSEPVPVSGNLSFGALAAGGDYTCGLTSTGAAYCWGDNSVGQLGNPSTTSSSIPVAVSGGQSFTALAAAGSFSPHTCGLTSGGAGFCWGYNYYGELG